jgi:hypothetical protein
MTPFIQVTWDGTEAPIRQTVSVLGAEAAGAEVEVVGVVEPVVLVLLPELQPAIASAAAASAAAAVILFRTGVLLARRGVRVPDVCLGEKLIGNFPIS